MPSVFSHSVFAYSIGSLPSIKNQKFKFFFLLILSSIVPDFDVISFKLGISYQDILGHRGITHSIFFSIMLGFIFSLLMQTISYKEKIFFAFVFSLGCLSHAFLDSFTNGGLGVCWFCPFESKRYFFDFRPIQVSPIGKNFFSARGLEVILSEFIWVWIPSVLILIFGYIKNRFSISKNK
jgi:inner membrane protein